MNADKNTIICVSYIHPEYYPPTLNAIGELSKIFDSVFVLFRAHKLNEWDYNSNVELLVSGKPTSLNEQESAPTYSKIFWFVQFTIHLWWAIGSKKPKYVLLYDPIPLFSFYLIRFFCTKDLKIWYHNHDIAEISKVRKYSIGWFAAKCESRMFPYLDIFSLPSDERKRFFPIGKLKGRYFYLPNYPSIIFYGKFFHDKTILHDAAIKLIYQGNVGEGHGLELIASILGETINGHGLELHIAGTTSEEMRTKLQKLAGIYSHKIIFHGRLSYKELPKLTSQCDIGIAINEPKEIIYQTGGSASNKIYEYAACGLPILYFNNEHYKNYLRKFDWALPVNLNKKSFKISVEKIINTYNELSSLAHKDFENDLNFESHFSELFANFN